MPDPTVQLGVSGVIVALCLIAIKVLWSALQTERAKRDGDQQAMLPALTQATAAVSASVLAIDRVTVLYEHRALPPPGDGR